MPDPSALAGVMRTQQFFDELTFRYVNVVAVGVGYRQKDGAWTEELAVQAYVSRKYPAAAPGYENTVPPFLLGPDGASIRTDIIEVGLIPPAQDTATYRPLQPPVLDRRSAHHRADRPATRGPRRGPAVRLARRHTHLRPARAAHRHGDLHEVIAGHVMR